MDLYRVTETITLVKDDAVIIVNADQKAAYEALGFSVPGVKAIADVVPPVKPPVPPAVPPKQPVKPPAEK